MMIKVKFVTALMVIFLLTDAALACEISAQDIGIPQQQYDKIILESERDGKDGCTVIRGISRVIAVYSAAKAIESDPTSPLPPEGQGRVSVCDITAQQLGLSSRSFQAILLASRRAGLDECRVMTMFAMVYPNGIAPSPPAPPAVLRGKR